MREGAEARGDAGLVFGGAVGAFETVDLLRSEVGVAELPHGEGKDGIAGPDAVADQPWREGEQAGEDGEGGTGEGGFEDGFFASNKCGGDGGQGESDQDK